MLHGCLKRKNEQIVSNTKRSAEDLIVSATKKVHRVLIYPKLSFAQHFSLLLQIFHLVTF